MKNFKFNKYSAKTVQDHLTDLFLNKSCFIEKIGDEIVKGKIDDIVIFQKKKLSSLVITICINDTTFVNIVIYSGAMLTLTSSTSLIISNPDKFHFQADENNFFRLKPLEKRSPGKQWRIELA